MKIRAKAMIFLFLAALFNSCVETQIMNPNKYDPEGEAKELVLAKSSVVIEEGAVESIKITSGNGEYSAAVTAGEEFITASVSDETVFVTAIAAGNATIVVSDREEKSASIKITVKQAEAAIEPNAVFEQNMLRSMELVDLVISKHSRNDYFDMRQWYNPVNSKFGNTASVWDYTGIIEAVNAILLGLEDYKTQNPDFYNEHFTTYSDLLGRLYDNITYYRGKFTLISFTQTKEWRVYAVPRAAGKDGADVGGGNHRNNVYDDQQWLIKELLETYHLTNEAKYLEEAEYLTLYVLDGWDCTLDGSGNEYGGIPWGPGYVTMHACSNGPMVSPLVWLHELYKGKSDQIEHRYIGGDDKQTRMTRMVAKDEYYLEFAKKIYDYQKRRLRRSDNLYADMIGGASGTSGYPIYETVDGVQYRAHTALDSSSAGSPHSYNCGTMLSGAADLYRATGDATYLDDAKATTSASFSYFAGSAIQDKPGCRKFRDTSDYSRWFDNILMRGYNDLYPHYNNTSVCLATYQSNLDYAYENSRQNGFLPKNLTEGWSATETENNVQILATCAYATEYAILARFELQKQN